MKTNRYNASYSTSNRIAGSSSSKSLAPKNSRRSQNELQKKKQIYNTSNPSLRLKSHFVLDDAGNSGPPEEPASGEAPPVPSKPSWRESTKNTINKGVDKVFDVLDDGQAKCIEAIDGAKNKFVETGRKFLDSIEKL